MGAEARGSASLYRFTVSIYGKPSEAGFPGRRPAYSMFCTCSRSCSIATFMSTEMRGHLERGRLRAERVGLAQQLLDQEVEPLADLAALGEQALDLVEVRAQPGQLLGDVDADREGRGFVEGALLRAPRARSTAPRRWPPAPPSSARGSAAAGAARPPGTSGSACAASVAQLRDALAAAPRPAARLRARAPRAGRRRQRRGGLERPAASSRSRRRAAAAPLQHLVHRQRARRSAASSRTVLSSRARWCELLGRAAAARRSRRSPRAVRRSSILPRLKRAGEQLAQRRLEARATRRAGAARGRESGR